MEYLQDEPELSNFVLSELTSVRRDTDFARRSEEILETIRNIAEDEDQYEHYSTSPRMGEPDKSDECILFGNDEEPVFNFERQPEEDQCVDTKITIKLDDLDVEDLKCSEDAEQESEKVSSHQVLEHVVQKSPVKEPMPRPAPKIQVVNSHNLKRNDVILKSILRSMRRFFCKTFLLVTKFKKTEKQQKVRRENLIK